MAKYFTKDGDEYKEVDSTLLTQDEVDGVVEKRLERERKKFEDYDDLKEKAGKVDKVKSEYEGKLKEKDTKLSDLEKKLNKTELEKERVSVLREFNIPDDVAEFVDGEDADQMRERAEKLSKNIKGGNFKIEKKGKPKGKDSDNRNIARELFGKSSDD